MAKTTRIARGLARENVLADNGIFFDGSAGAPAMLSLAGSQLMAPSHAGTRAISFSTDQWLPSAREHEGPFAVDTIPGGVSTTEILSAPGARTSTIDVAGDTDWFRVSFNAGQSYSILVTGAGGVPVANPYFSIYFADGSLLRTEADGDLSNLIFAGGGNFFLAVGAAGSATGDYTVTITSIGQDSIWDGTSTNGALTVNGPAVSSAIENGGDQDWFRVELVAGQHYVFTLNGSGGAPLSDPYLELRDSTGTLIALDDDGGPGTNAMMQFTAVESGVYYLNARPYGLGQVGDYTISAATGAPQNPLDTLDLGFTFDTNHITFYFATAGQTLGPMGTALRDWTGPEQASVLSALGALSNVADLTFTQVTSEAAADFVFALTDLENGVLGQTSPGLSRAYLEFAPDGMGWSIHGTTPGDLAYSVILHEVGHALGLDHPHYDGGDRQVMQGVIDAFDSYGTFLLNQQIFTIMSYNDGWPAVGASQGISGGNAGTPMALDIAALQLRYGANLNANPGNNIYELRPGVGGGQQYVCIWDTGGIDTIFAATFGTIGPGNGAIIDLRAATLLNAIGGGGFVSYERGSNAGFTIAAGVVIENATGWLNDDLLIGNSAANTLIGGGGADTLAGNGGDDNLQGGLDNDTLSGGDGDDQLNGGQGGDLINGGDGFDTVRYDGAASGVIIYVDASYANTGEASGDNLTSIEGFVGSSFGDYMVGGVANNVLQGFLGADILEGHGGDDLLDGGDGDDNLNGGLGGDILDGGAGFDVARYDGATAGVTIYVDAAYANQGEAAGDFHISIEGIVGSFYNDYLVGGVANNILQGYVGDDILEGHGGDDLLDGGDGNDQMNGGAGGDIFDGGAGFDTVRYDGATAGVIAFMTDAWANTGEAAGDAYISIEALYGSNFNDTLAGASNSNELQGFDGTDFIYGYGGADFLGGGDGNDYLDGGTGLDQLRGDAGNDQFIFRAGESSGDRVLDFAGNGGAVGDNLLFIGYGTAAQGATFVQIDATHWQINSADGLIHDIITIANGATIDTSDYLFG